MSLINNSNSKLDPLLPHESFRVTERCQGLVLL